MNVLQKALGLASKAQVELIRNGKVSQEIRVQEKELLKEAEKMEFLLAKPLSENECIGALYLIVLLSDEKGEDAALQVVDDEDVLLEKLSKRSADYASVIWDLTGQCESIPVFYYALKRDRSIVEA